MAAPLESVMAPMMSPDVVWARVQPASANATIPTWSAKVTNRFNMQMTSQTNRD
jgi:hypothetical protein